MTKHGHETTCPNMDLMSLDIDTPPRQMPYQPFTMVEFTVIIFHVNNDFLSSGTMQQTMMA